MGGATTAAGELIVPEDDARDAEREIQAAAEVRRGARKRDTLRLERNKAVRKSDLKRPLELPETLVSTVPVLIRALAESHAALRKKGLNFELSRVVWRAVLATVLRIFLRGR